MAAALQAEQEAQQLHLRLMVRGELRAALSAFHGGGGSGGGARDGGGGGGGSGQSHGHLRSPGAEAMDDGPGSRPSLGGLLKTMGLMPSSAVSGAVGQCCTVVR